MHYILNIALTLAIGGLSSILTSSGQKNFAEVFAQSPLTPPSWVFPVVWTILYVLMAIGYTRVREKCPEQSGKIYWIQLAVNFLWPIAFFNFNWFLFSFFWLLALLMLVILMTLSFSKCDRFSAYLQIPYILWLLFAAYLNFMVYLLN